MYRVYALVVALSAITLYSTRIMFTLMIYRYVWFVPLPQFLHTFRRESQQQSNVVGFGEIYLISVLDLTLHRIIVGASYKRVLVFIVFAKRLFSRNFSRLKLRVSDTCLCHTVRIFWD